MFPLGGKKFNQTLGNPFATTVNFCTKSMPGCVCGTGWHVSLNFLEKLTRTWARCVRRRFRDNINKVSSEDLHEMRRNYGGDFLFSFLFSFFLTASVPKHTCWKFVNKSTRDFMFRDFIRRTDGKESKGGKGYRYPSRLRGGLQRARFPKFAGVRNLIFPARGRFNARQTFYFNRQTFNKNDLVSKFIPTTN